MEKVEKQLEVYWKETTDILDLGRHEAHLVWKLILRKYKQPLRFYHNLSHLLDLLVLYTEFKDSFKNKGAVLSAIWFHDIIYTSTSKKNEGKSAELAAYHLKVWRCDEAFIKRVYDMIIATSTHTAAPDDTDTSLFLDMDLAILGAEHEKYLRYAKGVRQEYFWCPVRLYREGRSKILKIFLNREFIYKTEMLRDKLEDKARLNIRNELKTLKIS